MKNSAAWNLERFRGRRALAHEQLVQRSVFQTLRHRLNDLLSLKCSSDALSRSWNEARAAVERLLEEAASTSLEQDSQGVPEELLALLRSSLTWLEECLPKGELDPPEAQTRLGELTELEERFSKFDLNSLYELLARRASEESQPEEAEETLDAPGLKLGLYSQITSRLQKARTEESELEPLLTYLESQYEDSLERMQTHSATPVAPEEWTVKLLLADRLMLEGYELWLNGLEELGESCSASQLNDPKVGEALTDLLEANRLWLTAEKFYR